MKADFTKFLGPLPTDPPPYVEPADAKPLVEPDAAEVCRVKLEVAKRQAANYDEAKR
jgi:hypothetical protein